MLLGGARNDTKHPTMHRTDPSPLPPPPLCIWDILCRFLSLKMSSQCQPKAFPGATLPDFVGRRM